MIFLIFIRANKDLSAKSRTVVPFPATASDPESIPNHDQTWICKFLPRPIENLLPNLLLLALTARTWPFQDCMLLIPKTKEVLRVGLGF